MRGFLGALQLVLAVFLFFSGGMTTEVSGVIGGGMMIAAFVVGVLAVGVLLRARWALLPSALLQGLVALVMLGWGVFALVSGGMGAAGAAGVFTLLYAVPPMLTTVLSVALLRQDRAASGR
jgi:hypothetical protein